MGVEWVMYLQSQVYTRITHGFSEKIKKEYGMTDLNFSKKKRKQTDSIFPYVSVSLLPALEQGRDLEGTSINAGLFTFQVDVTDNVSQQRAEKVAFEVLRIMKGMRFEVTAMPNFEDTEAPYRSTTRYRRLIGSGDIL